MNIVGVDMRSYRRVWVTSDLHGYHILFKGLMERIEFTREDLLIINGDSCDRGGDTFSIYEDILSMREDGYNIIHTLGNHEELMRLAVEEGEIYRWYRNGGRKTIDSYVRAGKDPEIHLPFIRSMPLAVDLGRYLVVHAGIAPHLPIDEQSPYEMVWIRDRFIKGKLLKTDKTIIYGHTPNLDGRIHLPDEQKISIDCGSYDTGVAGALEIKTMKEVYIATDLLDIYINPFFR